VGGAILDAALESMKVHGRIAICDADSLKRNCTLNISMVGFSVDFQMIQYQLRGLISILYGCSFWVTNFDMIEEVEVYSFIFGDKS
jgi:hypothetical protein